MVSAWLRSGRIQAMPSGTSCKAFSQWSFPWIRRLRREYVSNGDHGFLVKEHLTPGFMKSGVHVFFGEEGDVFWTARSYYQQISRKLLRIRVDIGTCAMTLQWLYTIQKNLHLSRKLLHRPWYVYTRYQFMCSVIVIEFPNVPLVHRWTLCWATEMM